MCYGASLRGDSPSLVQLKSTQDDPIDIWIRFPDDFDSSWHLVAVDPSSNVLELKQQLDRDFLSIPPEYQQLTFKNVVMEDGTTLEESGVDIGSSIYVSFN